MLLCFRQLTMKYCREQNDQLRDSAASVQSIHAFHSPHDCHSILNVFQQQALCFQRHAAVPSDQ